MAVLKGKRFWFGYEVRRTLDVGAGEAGRDAHACVAAEGLLQLDREA